MAWISSTFLSNCYIFSWLSRTLEERISQEFREFRQSFLLQILSFASANWFSLRTTSLDFFFSIINVHVVFSSVTSKWKRNRHPPSNLYLLQLLVFFDWKCKLLLKIRFDEKINFRKFFSSYSCLPILFHKKTK